MSAILFVLGLAAGSFLNVVIARYAPERFLLGRQVAGFPSRAARRDDSAQGVPSRRSLDEGGRSHCMSCGRTLRWFELIPLISYIAARGRCRRCGAKIGIRYPLVELAGGIFFAVVPRMVGDFYFLPAPSRAALDALWILAFLTLVVIAAIDIRFTIIPDEASVFLAALGVAIAFVSHPLFGATGGSFIGPYAIMFGVRGSMIMNRLFAVLAALAVFGLLFLLTRGRGMGFGDVKLAAAMALLFGWPDIIILAAIAFIAGSLVGAGFILAKKRRRNGFLPFGPFLALAAVIIFFWGTKILAWYFSLAGI